MVDAYVGDVPPWYKVEWFKLHMRPHPRLTSYITKNIPPLPPQKTVVQIFADFLRYLNNSVLDYIQETHYNGANLVSSEYEKEFVLTHPNGWEGVQQSQLRKAVIMGGLVPDNDDTRCRIHFVTEGEAGLHFCVRRGLAMQSLNVYSKDQFLSLETLQNISNVSALAIRLFCLLTTPSIHRPALTTKIRFSDIEEPQYIKFGRPGDRDEELGIFSGQIKLAGKQVANFFQPCIEAITEAVFMLSGSASKKISTVFLIGGFSASNYLYWTLKDSLDKLGLEIYRPDSHLNKAVADGAVSFYIDHFVRARYSKYTYGIASYVPYDITNVEHRQRLSTVFTDSDGVDNVQHVFSPILYKGTEVMELTEFREQFFRKAETRDKFPDPMTDDILYYRGHSDSPQWTDIDVGEIDQ
ncbi:hypothetical protein C0993_005972 [Termitomyces sp. T159_Od127]|nr:hypothetical protein C0993_005972 [Termitomyces sp. T159_Od127]